MTLRRVNVRFHRALARWSRLQNYARACARRRVLIQFRISRRRPLLYSVARPLANGGANRFATGNANAASCVRACVLLRKARGCRCCNRAD